MFLDVAQAVGLTPFRAPLPVDWDVVRGALERTNDPTSTSSDQAREVRNGGRHSIDVTYLAAAQATGNLRIETLHSFVTLPLSPKDSSEYPRLPASNGSAW